MKKIIGYQIIRNNGCNDIPDEFWSFEIIKDINAAISILSKGKYQPQKGIIRWVILPVFEGDIENPTII